MSKAATKALIDANITSNGVQAITGPILNNVLNTMVDDYGTQEEVSQLAQEVNEIIFGNTQQIDIAVTSGTSSLSRSNIYNSTAIPSGTKVRFTVTGASYIDKFRVVNDTWANVIAYTSFTDGQTFEVTLNRDTTQLGMYIEASHVIGTGTVKIGFTIVQASSIEGRISTLETEVASAENEITKINDNISISEITTVANGGGNSFIAEPYSFEVGETYYIKQVSGYFGSNKLATSSGDITPLVVGEFVKFVPLTTTQPYIYVGSTTGKTPPVLDIYAENSVRGDIESKAGKINYTTINVSRDGTSPSGRTIDFSGLTAIADALNSITDASETNRYIVHIEGEFHFTDPLDLTMTGGDEYSVILAKDFVDIEGDGPDKSIIFVDFPASATFHAGKTYSDYQPIYYHGTGGKISGMKIIGKNCRYAFHIETDTGAENKEIDIENCDVRYLGHPDYTGSFSGGFGTGLTSGQKWNIRNCLIVGREGAAAFAVHTPLAVFDNVATINFENCVFDGSIVAHNYQLENNCFINVKGCEFINGVGVVSYAYYAGKSASEHANYTRILSEGNNFRGLFNQIGFTQGASTRLLKGAALRIVSASTGATSVISFDETSSAFDSIIGDSQKSGEITTNYGWSEKYGYVFRDGGVGLSGQAFGTIDVDENSANTSAPLGKRLGDCSGTNKELGVIVDGVTKTITFDKNYTSMSNADILDEINTALGGDATADLFSPAKLYYPNMNGLQSLLCEDANSIMKGMGVVFTANGMRRAKNSDGYIDGICIDDTAYGQYGRIITKGYIFPYSYRNGSYLMKEFTALDNRASTNLSIGLGAGISTTNEGEFDTSATPKVLRMTTAGTNLVCWKILN